MSYCLQKHNVIGRNMCQFNASAGTCHNNYTIYLHIRSKHKYLKKLSFDCIYPHWVIVFFVVVYIIVSKCFNNRWANLDQREKMFHFGPTLILQIQPSMQHMPGKYWTQQPYWFPHLFKRRHVVSTSSRHLPMSGSMAWSSVYHN